MSKSFPHSLRKYDAYVACRFKATIGEVLVLGPMRVIVRELLSREEWERQRAHPCVPSRPFEGKGKLVGFSEQNRGQAYRLSEVVLDPEGPEELFYYGADGI